MAVARPESVATEKIERKALEVVGFGWRRSCRLIGAGKRDFCEVAVYRVAGWGVKMGRFVPGKGPPNNAIAAELLPFRL